MCASVCVYMLDKVLWYEACSKMICVLRVEVCYLSSNHWLLALTTCHASGWEQSVFLRFTSVKLAGCCS